MVRQQRGVDYEFDDKSLEKAKNQFLASVRSYVRVLINETFTHTGNPAMMTMDFSDWDNPPEKIKARDRLNKLGTDLLMEYERFVRVIRKKIKETEGGAGQPATRPESKSEGGDKPQPEAEGRSR